MFHFLPFTLLFSPLFIEIEEHFRRKKKESKVPLIKTKMLFNSVKLSLLGDYTRNEESINSTRNRISPLTVFHSLPY